MVLGLCLVLLTCGLHQRNPTTRREAVPVGGPSEGRVAAPIPTNSLGERKEERQVTVAAASVEMFGGPGDAESSRPASGAHVGNLRKSRSVGPLPPVGVGNRGEEESEAPLPAVVATCSEGDEVPRETSVFDGANPEALEGDGEGPRFAGGLLAAQEEKAGSGAAAAGTASAGGAENLEQGGDAGLLEREEDEALVKPTACFVNTGSKGKEAVAPPATGPLTSSNESEEWTPAATSFGPTAGGFEGPRAAQLTDHVSGGTGAEEGARQKTLSWTLGVTARGLKGEGVRKSCPGSLNLLGQHEELRQTTVTPTAGVGAGAGALPFAACSSRGEVATEEPRQALVLPSFGEQAEGGAAAVLAAGFSGHSGVGAKEGASTWVIGDVDDVRGDGAKVRPSRALSVEPGVGRPNLVCTSKINASRLSLDRPIYLRQAVNR